MKTVGIYLRGLRDTLGLTQAEAADLVGLAPKTIERWEAGRNEPKISDLSAYVQAVGGSVRYAVALLLDVAEGELSFDEMQAITRLSPEKKRLALELIDQLGRAP